MFGRVLLDDADYLVVMGLLGGLKITLKHRGLTRRCNPAEKAYFTQLVEALQRQGVPIEPGSEALQDAIHDFAGAVMGGDARWRAYFQTDPPDIRAKDYPPIL